VSSKLLTQIETRFPIYPAAVIFAATFYILHVVSLPLRITYDGLGYVDAADVLFSARFPHDWLPIRTPLLPLCLKVSWWLLGRQPIATILVMSTAGLAATLLLGAIMRRVVGDLAGAVALVLVSTSPVLVGYEHSVLTEAGTFFFIALVLYLTLRDLDDDSGSWYYAALLSVTLGTAYYWRQNILVLGPLAAFIHWRASCRRAKQIHGRKQIAAVLQSVVVIVLPPVLTSFWSPYLHQSGLRDVMLRQGMIKQALLPPEHPYVGQYRDLYFQAIQQSIYQGNYYSGTKWEYLIPLYEKIYVRPMDRSVPAFFFGLIMHYPARYLSGLGRSMIHVAGVNGAESDNRGARAEVLSPGSKISSGPEPLRARINEEFQQRPAPSALMPLLRLISPFYDYWVIVAHFVTLIGLLLAVAWRDMRLLTLCAIPVVYELGFVLLLASIDRFAVPVYPLVMCNGFVVPLLVYRHMLSRRTAAAKPYPPLP